MHRVFLSIGSNVGDSISHVRRAIQQLDNHGDMQVVSVSSLYRTQPQNYADQNWFVNVAVEVHTGISDPLVLLNILQSMERKMDEKGKPFRFGPRVIDLDMIFFDDLCLKTSILEIPHPRMHERSFVLRPICDIDAQIIHPVLQKKLHELLDEMKQVSDQEVIFLEDFSRQDCIV